jgi:hypothetical protein
MDRVSLVIESEWTDDAGKDHGGIWRIDFARIYAYRATSTSAWFRRLRIADRLPLPERVSALWEVTGSRWLEEVAASHGRDLFPRRESLLLHHYAVVDDISLYEFAAGGYLSCRLSDEEEAEERRHAASTREAMRRPPPTASIYMHVAPQYRSADTGHPDASLVGRI